MTKISSAGYRFPPEIIQQAIWLRRSRPCHVVGGLAVQWLQP
jgi:hypothetical protein